MSKTELTKEEKKLVNDEVLSIIVFQMEVLNIPQTPQMIQLASVMFVEGVKYFAKKNKEVSDDSTLFRT